MSALSLFLLRVNKFRVILRQPGLRRALFRYRVFAAVEHKNALSHSLSTVVDVGANRGQFALSARCFAPQARIFSFEPLATPADLYRRIFVDDNAVKLYESAIGPESIVSSMYLSAKDDSSSLLPISNLQDQIFSGTAAVGTVTVSVAQLQAFLCEDDIVAPAMLKLDVQGYELDALRGCKSLLHKFDWVYCECSFVELYSGQKLAADIIDWLAANGFSINGIYNTAYDTNGQSIQADFLFMRT